MNRRIYLRQAISDYFDLPYENQGVKTTIHTDALKRQDVAALAGGWDNAHKEIFNDSKDLQLFGVGHGWWEITNDSPMMSERVKKLNNSLEEKDLVKKTGKKSVDKGKLAEEFKRFTKINDRVEERLDEGGAWGAQGGSQGSRIGANPQSYATGFNPKAALTNYAGNGKTVNTFLPQMDNAGGMVNPAYLQPKEALSLSIRRTLDSGAPVNNLDFYAEVNWHLNSMGFDPKQPLDIKETLKKMLKEK